MHGNPTQSLFTTGKGFCQDMTAHALPTRSINTQQHQPATDCNDNASTCTVTADCNTDADSVTILPSPDDVETAAQGLPALSTIGTLVAIAFGVGLTRRQDD